MDSTEPFYESAKEEMRKEILRERHYYGDIVRSLFFAGAIVIAALPFFSAKIPFPKEFALVAILFFVVVAGMTDPVRKWLAILNGLISLIALAGFEYNALQTYTYYTQYPWFFWINQTLAINFFFASYYSIKTLRGMVLNT